MNVSKNMTSSGEVVSFHGKKRQSGSEIKRNLKKLLDSNVNSMFLQCTPQSLATPGKALRIKPDRKSVV